MDSLGVFTVEVPEIWGLVRSPCNSSLWRQKHQRTRALCLSASGVLDYSGEEPLGVYKCVSVEIKRGGKTWVAAYHGPGPEMSTKATVCGRIVFLSPPWLSLQCEQPLHVPAGTAMSAATAVVPSLLRPGHCARG